MMAGDIPALGTCVRVLRILFLGMHSADPKKWIFLQQAYNARLV